MKANQLATTCQGVAVTITAKYGMRADSRNIAELLGIKHRSFMKTIDRYSHSFKNSGKDLRSIPLYLRKTRFA